MPQPFRFGATTSDGGKRDNLLALPIGRVICSPPQKCVIPGLIASVRGEPDIHSAVGALPHEAAPLLDQVRLKGTPV